MRRMTRRIAPCFAALVFLVAGQPGCKKSDPATGEQAPAATAPADGDTKAAPAADEAPGAKSYGDPIGDSPEVALAELLASPDAYADKTVRTEGLVRQACTRKGCWMEVTASAEKDAAATRVTFKDYGFFVPTDSAGTQARLEGQVVIKTVDKGDVEHLESEGAKFVAKADDGSAREVQFIASGVELTR